ncbi:hypothetical protein PJU73_07885 [Neisseria lisongii]|uniref:Uncharacterized protein n=1 Tax=Neisseria lisongii TaxID=2912188 RepID=A0ABY7RIG6_9NEIS|nr:hypothetical protein [Neisseria lisongii]WCL71248.1 hypothetical protein PJU73_07885 [Neisseria lisongii]
MFSISRQTRFSDGLTPLTYPLRRPTLAPLPYRHPPCRLKT